MKKIAASILGIENKTKKINELIEKGIEWIHYDIMDGNFVHNTSLPICEVKEIIKNTKKHNVDIHLMVQNPKPYIEKLINVANQFSIHYESKFDTSLKSIIKNYKDKTNIGIVINPSTKVELINEYLKDIHHVMIMSVIPGKGGQTFDKSSLDKVKYFVNKIRTEKLNLILEIDGGINNIWGPIVFREGINLAVSGSYLINNLENNSINKLLGKEKEKE